MKPALMSWSICVSHWLQFDYAPYLYFSGSFGRRALISNQGKYTDSYQTVSEEPSSAYYAQSPPQVQANATRDLRTRAAEGDEYRAVRRQGSTLARREGSLLRNAGHDVVFDRDNINRSGLAS